MRMWSFHPKYLDTKGFVAEWRESLLARKVLEGKTKGWTKHPQLNRFRQAKDPISFINNYLKVVYQDSKRRNFNFDESKLVDATTVETVKIEKSDYDEEWKVYLNKIKIRAPTLYKKYKNIKKPMLHPCFKIK